MKARALILLLVLGLAPQRALGQKDEAAEAYESARRYFFILKTDPQKQRFRHHWHKAIAGFQAVAARYPKSPQAASALYTVAELWRGLYRISRLADDLEQAESAYALVGQNHAATSLADDALWHRVKIANEVRGDKATAATLCKRLLATYPSSDSAKEARSLWPKLAGALPQQEKLAEAEAAQPAVGRSAEGQRRPAITEVKHWSNDEYSRVVLYLDGVARARKESAGAVDEVVVRLRGVSAPSKLQGIGDVHDDLLQKAELEVDGDDTRVVLHLVRAAESRLSVLESPYRVVIDAFTAERPPTRSRLSRRPRVVIDPGHGGADGGARAKSGLAEKEVTLGIARELSAILEKQQIDVILTRDRDRYVGLEERTAIANRAEADLFVSLHVNAHKQPGVRGLETYYLDTTDDRYALRLAARENATLEERASEVQLVLADLATKANTEESRALAQAVQRELVAKLAPLNPGQRDLGVKGSLFYVLLGARMPAVLVETSFLSNPKEAALLGTKAYRHATAAAIARGIKSRLDGPLLLARP